MTEEVTPTPDSLSSPRAVYVHSPPLPWEQEEKYDLFPVR